MNKIAILALAAAAMLPLGAFAASTLTRDEVNAQTLAAAKAGMLTPAGQGTSRMAYDQTPMMMGSGMALESGMTRAQHRAAVLEARKNNMLTPAGEAATPMQR
jgi:hypothetical protein